MTKINTHKILKPVIATGITASLFFSMSQLIAQEQIKLDEGARPIIRDLSFTPEPMEVKIEEPIVKPPPPVVVIPPPIIEIGEDDKGIVIDTTPPTIPIERKESIDIGMLSDGDFLPLILATPTYPNSAMMRKIEGYALVGFEIDSDGSVVNPYIIESEPNSVFDKASLTAIKKFRFKPRVVNNAAVLTSGARYKFVFTMPE